MGEIIVYKDYQDFKDKTGLSGIEAVEFEANEMRIVATSESFDIIKIVNEGGVPFTNATSTVVLDGRLIFNTTENEYNVLKFKEPWNLPAQTKLTFDITDTSGSTIKS